MKEYSSHLTSSACARYMCTNTRHQYTHQFRLQRFELRTFHPNPIRRPIQRLPTFDEFAGGPGHLFNTRPPTSSYIQVKVRSMSKRSAAAADSTRSKRMRTPRPARLSTPAEYTQALDALSADDEQLRSIIARAGGATALAAYSSADLSP